MLFDLQKQIKDLVIEKGITITCDIVEKISIMQTLLKVQPSTSFEISTDQLHLISTMKVDYAHQITKRLTFYLLFFLSYS